MSVFRYNLISSEMLADDWHRWIFDDGLEQLAQLVDARTAIFIERVVGPTSRRKQWVIVNRAEQNDSCYPPKIAGPFPTLEAAKVAYMMIVAAKSANQD